MGVNTRIERGRLNMGKLVKVGNLREDVAESMFSKWDTMIQYEKDNAPEDVKDFDLEVKGFYQEEGREVNFGVEIHIGIKSTHTKEYVENEITSLEGLRELREIRNFYERLKEKLGLGENVRIGVDEIKVNNK